MPSFSISSLLALATGPRCLRPGPFFFFCCVYVRLEAIHTPTTATLSTAFLKPAGWFLAYSGISTCDHGESICLEIHGTGFACSFIHLTTARLGHSIPCFSLENHSPTLSGSHLEASVVCLLLSFAPPNQCGFSLVWHIIPLQSRSNIAHLG